MREERQAHPPARYAERLGVPLRWWVQATMFLATVWLAFVVSLPAWIAWAASAALLGTVYGIFAYIGAARVEVRDQRLYAGPAMIDLALTGPAVALDAERTRRVHGVDADARAYLLTRPYLKLAVQVPITDPCDPTPYWLISTRHPRELTAALTQAAGCR